MKKWIGGLSAALAAAAVLAVPASALTTLTSDSFSQKEASANWVTAKADPLEFYVEDGELYMSVGRYSYSSDASTRWQGKKIALKKPTSNTWTAVIKLDIDDGFFSSSYSQQVEFRLDLVDKNGKALSESPALRLVKSGSKSPQFNYYSTTSQTGWKAGTTYINGDGERADVEFDSDWHSLIIRCDKGVIYYYLDNKKLGTTQLSTKEVYPAFAAINMYNYGNQETTVWDNFALYNGSYILPAERSEKAQEEYEEEQADKYEEKRQEWRERYTKYDMDGDGEYESTLKQVMQKDSSVKNMDDADDRYDSELTKEIPDRLWKY